MVIYAAQFRCSQVYEEKVCIILRQLLQYLLQYFLRVRDRFLQVRNIDSSALQSRDLAHMRFRSDMGILSGVICTPIARLSSAFLSFFLSSSVAAAADADSVVRSFVPFLSFKSASYSTIRAGGTQVSHTIPCHQETRKSNFHRSPRERLRRR